MCCVLSVTEKVDCHGVILYLCFHRCQTIVATHISIEPKPYNHTAMLFLVIAIQSSICFCCCYRCCCRCYRCRPCRCFSQFGTVLHLYIVEILFTLLKKCWIESQMEPLILMPSLSYQWTVSVWIDSFSLSVYK